MKKAPKGRRKPNLYIIAGPNGAGKTTFAREFLPNYVNCYEFINADLIAAGLSPFLPEKGAMKAGRILIEQIDALSERREDFGFETTLSGKTHLKLFRDLKGKGYRIHVFFLWLASVDLALERIADRVRRGGHNVPEEVARRRFGKGLRNFFLLYKPLFDSWMIFNNSEKSPALIAFERSGKCKILDPDIFKEISNLINS